MALRACYGVHGTCYATRGTDRARRTTRLAYPEESGAGWEEWVLELLAAARWSPVHTAIAYHGTAPLPTR
eukprot:2428080-Rhodomonas_salina.1